MGTGAITGYFDVAQVTLYAFWIFFFGLVFYLRMEDKREGYPLVTESPDEFAGNFPPIPSPKTFLLRDGTSVQAPRSGRPEPASKTTPLGIWTGTPSDPEGNPLLSASGPAAYALRADTPELVWDNDRNRLEPLRVATDHAFDDEGPNPIGYDVVGFDGVVAGTVSDAWIDREESLIRYLEAKLTSGRSVLIPMPLSQVSETARQVRLASVKGAQVNDAPGLASPDQVTWLEEDRIQAYFASGHLFAEPGRREPLL